jgi:formate dehydrogenase subunit delta
VKSDSHLIHMANQIATYFAPYPHDEALAGVVNHLEKFWEKRMRQQLHQCADGGGAGLHPLIVEAEKLIERPHAAHAEPNKAVLQSGLED